MHVFWMNQDIVCNWHAELAELTRTGSRTVEVLYRASLND